jgi:putative DNA primase/helicase
VVREVADRQGGKPIAEITAPMVLEALLKDEEKPWTSYNRGRPMTPRQMSRRPKIYGIVTKPLRCGREVTKDYDKEQFQDAFTRYLSPDFFVAQLHPVDGAGLRATDMADALVAPGYTGRCNL